MAMMKIYCGYCNQYWEVYQHNDWKSDKARTCPHCFNRIDSQTWERQILPAFGEFQDMNRELIKDNLNGSVRFSVDFREDYYFPEKKTQLDNEE